MTQEITFADDVRSLNKPSWDSTTLCCTGKRSIENVERKYLFLRTRNGIFERAYVTRETRDTITVRFIKKSNADKGRVVTDRDIVKKSDILYHRVYKD